jgi:outer membrane protein assembly factor BamE (lipoprotein component of BamABCDE complex)
MKISQFYRMNHPILKVAIILLFCTSCIVQSPKYASLDQVMSLQLGMTKTQVEGILGIEPYDLKANTDTSNVFIYVYRINDRRTLSFATAEVNGRKSIGKYVQLFVTYSKYGKVTEIESCSLCPDNLVTRRKLDFEKMLVFITVTLPALLLYFGLQGKTL